MPREVYTELEIASKLMPLNYFCPNGAQEMYINTVAKSMEESKIPVVLCTFANGVGKTWSTLHIILNFIYGQQNGWFKHDVFKQFPFPKKIWYCSTADTIRDTIIPCLDGLLLDNTYIEEKAGKHYTSRIEFKNGWELFFKTYDQDPKTYESATVGIVVADEPMPEHLWKAVKSRRRMGCVVLLPMTPLYCPPYVIDEVQESADQNRAGYYHIKGHLHEACKDRGTRGHLEPDIVDAMIEDYDPEERKARVEGEPMYFSGRIFTTLERDRHFVDPSEFPITPDMRVIQIVDPHENRLSACIWMAIAKNGRKIIFMEYPEDKSLPFWEFKQTTSVSDEVAIWKKMEESRNIFSPERIIDKRFGFQTRGQTNLATLYAQEGIKQGIPMGFQKSYDVPTSEGELAYGHEKIRESLKDMPDGSPALVIYNTCYHTWNGMSHYIRKHEVTASAGDRASADGKIVEKFKDFVDVVRYGVCCEIGAKPEMEKKSYAQILIEKKQKEKLKKGRNIRYAR
tara:strand:- start:27701 stop:29233 length:1533 start_codon:yes stop_codon:yes gene_type:complete